MNLKSILIFGSLLQFVVSTSIAQTVPIINHSVNANGQVQLEINAKANHYYILKVKENQAPGLEIPTSMTLGKSGKLILSEPLGALSKDEYLVFEYPVNNPADTDDDGIDDITEYNNIPDQSPINAAESIGIQDGVVYMDSFSDYKKLSIRKEWVQFSEYLNGLGHFKFIIGEHHTANPRTFFINTNTHSLHQDFALSIGTINHLATSVKKGQIVYHPTSISANGTLGTFAFNYTGGHGDDFDVIQRSHELLAANMPFLKNNLSYFVTDNGKAQYLADKDSFSKYRIPVLLEEDVYADVNYWGLNQTEGYGLFRKVARDEVPAAKDIVLYETIPNALPRVGGIITSVIQTPLSHVNLRAIQDKVPNAFIRDPLLIDSVADLLDKYIYFKVEQDKYFIREATQQEVNDWYEDIRPTQEQDPPLNLCRTEILPLSKIGFKMYDSYGAKCANLATLRTFNFPQGTIPDGFGVPFHYYQEFMKHNNFFPELEKMLNDKSFQADRLVRDVMLDAFRKKIRAGSMPTWMLNNLDDMHNKFPLGTSVRCRSSTNNEDLPGFNGAGLYSSKTQHPDEGHISKSIKQVYASLWNLRAFEERDFYRVNHYKTSMGVLCHPNFSDEIANGVGVSTDPLYNTNNTFYLNSQVGEELITNPDSNAAPEEILLDRISLGSNDYIVIQRSNLLHQDSVIMSDAYLNQMREYLNIIHDEFKILYKAENIPQFAMDIEYKIDKDNQLVIKQARPWVTYSLLNYYSNEEASPEDLIVYPNPVINCINVECDNCGLAKITITDITGRQLQQKTVADNNNDKRVELDQLPPGIYFLNTFLENNQRFESRQFIKR